MKRQVKCQLSLCGQSGAIQHARQIQPSSQCGTLLQKYTAGVLSLRLRHRNMVHVGHVLVVNVTPAFTGSGQHLPFKRSRSQLFVHVPFQPGSCSSTAVLSQRSRSHLTTGSSRREAVTVPVQKVNYSYKLRTPPCVTKYMSL